MKIMSFNILCSGRIDGWEWEKRVPLVTALIRRYMPDSLGVQEAHKGWMDALTAALPEYAHVGVGRDDGKDAGEFSAVFYKKDKFTLLDSGTFWLSETPGVPSHGWDGACTRICSWAKLRCDKCGKTYVHMNTHIDHKGPQAQVRGAALVAERSRDICAGLPCVLTGDFNVEPDDPAAKILLAEFSDPRTEAPGADAGITYHGYFLEGIQGSVIDYALYKNGFKPKEFSVLRDKFEGVYPSDHFPVLAKLCLKDD